MQPANPMTREMIMAAVCLFFLAAVGCERQPQQAPPPPSAPQVRAVTVQPQAITLTTELPGRISAYRVAEIRPQVSGLIQRRLFTEGADVIAGDVLYRIDPASFEAALNNADAALRKSQANLPALQSRVARYEELLAEKAVSQQDYDDAAAALKLAQADAQFWQASLETARINLAYTQITAPISGRIGKSNVTEGAIVTAYQPLALATIQQLDPIYVDVPQSTTELLRLQRRLKEGRLDQKGKNQNAVTLIMEDGSAYPLEGSFQFRDVSVDPTTGSVILRAVFPNPEKFLLPGMFVRAILKEGVNQRAMMIPQQAVSRDPKGNPTVLIVDADDTAQQRALTLDRAVDDQWLVLSGLAPGDRVIVEGVQKVRPGMVVKVAPLASPAPADDPKTDAATARSTN
ncbi:MAG: efflux RND transporter periplasmic adaptor subunit [Desulfosarcina sp.]